jgi:GT2 family glycosyltransferase
VVVTYNRRKLLSECISALKNQTRSLDKILVVNNGSTDDTSEWLDQQDGIEFISQENVGSAGGFNEGIKNAYEGKYSWIWLMDDDGYPKENALEKLLDNDPEELCLRNCIVLNKDDKKSLVWKTGKFTSYEHVDQKVIMNYAHPFNGTMIHRKIVERVGLPRKQLFLWGDEGEYLYRIIKLNKIPCCTISDSIHYHPATSFSYKNDWNFNSGWKMYYYVRNRYHILVSKFCKSKVLAFMLYIGFLFAFAGSIILFQKTNKFKKLGMIWWPAKDAFARNFFATPSSIMEKLSKL